MSEKTNNPFYKTGNVDATELSIEEIKNHFEKEVMEFRKDQVRDEFKFWGGPKGVALRNIKLWLIAQRNEELTKRFEEAMPELKNYKIK